ncbi:MAG TPA: hypothetical protein VFI38_15010 [Candidatus Acidoferrum sp.]|nr:hypothetical protein [Candidatus Acidoferrum sp.]
MGGATQEARTAVMILVEATWLDLSGEVQSVTARMENRSEHGACIRIKQPVAVGKRIYIQSHREEFSGIARYCRVDGKEFLVGLQRDSVNQPAPKKPAEANDLDPQTKREAGRRAERAEEAGLKASATFKNKSARSATTASRATSAARDAEWLARRTAEPRRDSVPHRSTASRAAPEEDTKLARDSEGKKEGTTLRCDSVQVSRAPTALVREYIARVEEPIAERLMEHEMRRTESPPGGPPLAAASYLPTAGAKVGQQVSAGNGIEKKARKKGRGIMKLKWFAGDEEELLRANGGNNAPGEQAQREAEASARSDRGMERAAARAVVAESASGFETELLPVEDIYRAAGITSPRRGYSVTKVVEMLRSEHLRGASRELRRAAVLMALDAAGVTVDEVLQDAKVRQEAIDAYATEQRKHAEAQWARKAEENIQIQAELEVVKAHYGERIRRNLDGVAREKATFGSWLKMKEQETQGMAEAVEQVLKAPTAAEAATDPLLSVTVSSATGKPV